jgi:hypothetical protein
MKPTYQSSHFKQFSLPFVFACQIFKPTDGQPLIFAFVTEKANRNNRILAICLIYASQLHHLGWVTFRTDNRFKKTGPHIKLLEKLLPLVPENLEVVLLGDTENYLEIFAWIRTKTNWRLLLSNWQDKFIEPRRAVEAHVSEEFLSNNY